MSSAAGAITLCEQRYHELISHAKQCQLDGDLVAAIGHAQMALSLGCDVCAVHALLGHLYEQSGNALKAHQHFQRALEVAPAQAEVELSVAPMIDLPAAPQLRGVWLMAVLFGCILFSGLAALFTLFPGERNIIGHGTILQPGIPVLPPNKDLLWTAKVPSPIHQLLPEPLLEHATNTPMAETNALLVGDMHVEGTRGSLPASAHVPEQLVPTAVLGPAASVNIPAEAIEPTIEHADQEYFRGQYERAINLYEEIMYRQEKPDPRMLQNLAWCYHQLGNSAKAAEHLQMAMQGYQYQLGDDPQSVSAKQGLRSCEAALHTLQATP